MSTQNNNMSRRNEMDPNKVPELFRPLIPYAEKWGFNYTHISQLIEETPIEELRALVKTISEFNAEGFDEWLGDPGKGNNTKEWRAFVLLIDTYDIIKIRMDQNRLPPESDNNTIL